MQSKVAYDYLMNFVICHLDNSNKFYQGFVDPILNLVKKHGTPNKVLQNQGRKYPMIAYQSGVVTIMTEHNKITEWHYNCGDIAVVSFSEYKYLLNMYLSLNLLNEEIKKGKKSRPSRCPICGQSFTIDGFRKHVTTQSPCKYRYTSNPYPLVSANDAFFEAKQKALEEYRYWFGEREQLSLVFNYSKEEAVCRN